MSRFAVAMGASLLLSGCVTDYVCPPIAAYSDADQKKVAAEIRGAPADAKWPDFMADYLKHRNACRAIGLGAS